VETRPGFPGGRGGDRFLAWHTSLALTALDFVCRRSGWTTASARTAFVDGLDLAAAGFERVRPKSTGRPGHDPRDLLKLYIHGYLNRVRSSRRLEVETRHDIESLPRP